MTWHPPASKRPRSLEASNPEDAAIARRLDDLIELILHLHTLPTDPLPARLEAMVETAILFSQLRDR